MWLDVIKYVGASKRPDRTVQRHELHQTGNGMPIKRGDASSTNYTPLVISLVRSLTVKGGGGGRGWRPKWLRMTAQLDRSSSSTNPLSISISFKSNEKAIKNKRVLVNTENESKVGVLYIVRVCMYVYIRWFVCTVAMIYFPVKRRIFVFPAVEMNVGQKWPRNKRPALNTHAYFIRMNYCGGLCLPSLPPSFPRVVTSTTTRYTYRTLPSRSVR